MLVPGFFNTGECFQKFISFIKKGFACFPLNLPRREKRFNETPDPKTGDITIKDDVRYVAGEVKKIYADLN